jgi:NADH dehydrogenase
MADNIEKHKIVIVGGGAAGLELATSLGKNWVKKTWRKLPC